ncbi:biotin--[acetyl-CoA-carboxylase] ligase [Neorhizobium lilium]|uniref:biotin--[biotin carboxyl-carrier protein] ligase n=1 Tax=Neorhizobium lilium TaxID=2503024 RepID=A0A3S3VKM1_9HYPH|nr:biotin--[acetyl-CoA-carboxylase] ligase [Neorhizobium lilium]RWX78829.1 biotin--[acetyl-CoA-carboxylase] ligase [Neorhizobium lilium]
MAVGRNGRFSLEAFRHESLSEVGSTNSECLARARAGDSGLLWVTADRQTAGRGRRGRSWMSEPGNLYASLLMLDPAPPHLVGSLPLAVAVAVHGAIRSVLPAGAPALEVKWPNDILIGRAKTCGILIEGEIMPNSRHALVVGIGINIQHMPDNAPYGVTRLADHRAGVSAQEVFAHLYREMAEVLELWNEGQGTREVTRRWRSIACGIGENITVNLPERSLVGRFAGINDDGFLQLETKDGIMLPIAAGDVFFHGSE